MTSSRLAALVLVVLAGAGCAGPRSNTEVPPVISVTASGRVAARPDTALVQVGAETRAARLADATGDVARRLTEVLARVKALGVEAKDITTVVYTVDPLVAPRPGEEEPPRIVGYRAANVVQLKVRNLDLLGRIVDEAVAGGANVVRGLHFTVDDPARPEAEARAIAVRQATARARQLADAAGVRLGGLVALTEGAPPPQPLLERLGRAAMSAPGAPGPVEAGQLEVVVTVQAQFLIERGPARP